MNKIAQISKTAKKIRKPGEAWLSAIKRASKQIGSTSLSPSKKRAKKKAAPKKKTVKRKLHQTGASNLKADRMHHAKPPGKRKSKAKKTYYENRKNRSDMPGKLTGTKVRANAYSEMILGRIRSSVYAKSQSEMAIDRLKKALKETSVKDKPMKTALRKEIEKYKAHVRAMSNDIRMLKALLR